MENFYENTIQANATADFNCRSCLTATAIILSELRRWKRRSRATRVRFNSTWSAWAKYQADAALRIRSALNGAFTKTQIITNSRSSLQNGSVLVCLLNDRRIIRDDATLYFRRANLSEIKVAEPDESLERRRAEVLRFVFRS